MIFAACHSSSAPIYIGSFRNDLKIGDAGVVRAVVRGERFVLDRSGCGGPGVGRDNRAPVAPGTVSGLCPALRKPPV